MNKNAFFSINWCQTRDANKLRVNNLGIFVPKKQQLIFQRCFFFILITYFVN